MKTEHESSIKVTYGCIPCAIGSLITLFKKGLVSKEKQEHAMRALLEWTQMTSYSTQKDIATGDFTGDGNADVASNWTSGLWYQNGATLDWTKVPSAASS